ncbi:agamous-like MADS-box protein AGL80 [Curcuma longa]|uniref:agamous-like MADS-box protein AGL80 n=1 Tax=Curcuma longa TaxID=136217 RepID=UPI003D9DC9CD
MARCKVKLVRIANASTRRTTLRKRLKGLMKKVRELTVLCGVEAAAVVFDPQDPLHPAAWPSRREAALSLQRFRALPEVERLRKMTSQEAFLRQRVAKVRDQLRRQQLANHELEMSALLFEGLSGRSLQDVSIENGYSLSLLVDNKLQEIAARRQELAMQLAVASAPPPLPPPPPSAPMPLQQNINWPPPFSSMITSPPVGAPAPGHDSHAAAGNLHNIDQFSGAKIDPFLWSDSLFS